MCAGGDAGYRSVERFLRVRSSTAAALHYCADEPKETPALPSHPHFKAFPGTLLGCLITLSAPGHASVDPVDRLWSQSAAQLRAGDAAHAVRTLARLTRVSPADARAWSALGKACLQIKDFRCAARAFDRSLQIDPESPRALFGLGEAYAGRHDSDRAFRWLQRARASHRYDMTEMIGNADFDALRADPRWSALLPVPDDFERPFVEPVKVIREWRGEAAGDQFGWIARAVGDVDGDGVTDIVTSAPAHGANGSAAGRIYVYSVGTGKLLWTADGQSGDGLGSGVEGVGDTNGDGIPDVAASGPEGSGVAYIYSGRDGHVLHEFRPSRPDEIFGNHISGAGDVDGDGFADVIIGAPGKPSSGENPGHAYVYSGKDGSLLMTLGGERAGDSFGSAVAGYGGRGQHLLVIGAPSAGKDRHGKAYVYRDGATKPTFTINADSTGSALGAMFVSVVGDVDGDGVPDIYASDWANGARGPSTGRIYVYSGRTGERLHVLTGENMGDGFGTSPSAAGDVDGDGHADLIVGAWQYAQAAVSGGRAYLYSGRDGQLIRTFTCRTPGDTFGFDAVGLGDVDHDGMDDLLITAGWSAVNGHHSGRVFVISSGLARR